MNPDDLMFAPENLGLLPVWLPAMREIPPLFDFETQGHMARPLVAAMHHKLKQLGLTGLSANQVHGENWPRVRVFMVGSGDQCKAFFNPVITSVSKDQVVMEEGCITIPEFTLALKRPVYVNIQYQDEDGVAHHEQYTGVTARIILHEYDHMVGRNFMDHASNFKMRWEVNKYKKQQKKKQLATRKEKAHG